jgi:Prophage antirepressor
MNNPKKDSVPAVFLFQSTEVRAVDRDGQIWFVASDVAKALGYRDAMNMTRVLDPDEKGTHIMSTLGGDQQVAIISESGLFHALLKSRKREAKPFRRWVTQEVLPEIRRTGVIHHRHPLLPYLPCPVHRGARCC